jgi:hypothetical protein
MAAIARGLLLASLIAYHAAVSLCGPCLHGLTGSPHEPGAASKPHRTDSPAGSRGNGESADLCLICQFVAQSQLPVEFRYDFSTQAVTELVAPVHPITGAVSLPLLPVPRAPPIIDRASS